MSESNAPPVPVPPDTRRYPTFEARKALATAKQKHGLMSQHVFDVRVAWIESTQVDGYVELPVAWLTEPARDGEVLEVPGGTLSSALYSPPGELIGLTLSFLGWGVLVLGLLGALLVLGNTSYDSPSGPGGALSLVFASVVSSATLHGLASVIGLLRSIDRSLHAPAAPRPSDP